MIMSTRNKSTSLRTAISTAIAAGALGAAHASTGPALAEPARFPSYEDGFATDGAYVDIDTPFLVHVGMERMGEVIDRAVKAYCEDDTSCHLDEVIHTRVPGEPGKSSEYTTTKVVVKFSEDLTHELHPLGIVRSCPDGAMLVKDDGRYMENRTPPTANTPVACVLSDVLPRGSDLGAPKEDGSNQCPVGNARTVGNPIDPLTMSKIEYALDYADPTGSGLDFARTYHSGASDLLSREIKSYKRSAERSRMGAGWRHSWDRHLSVRKAYDAEAGAYTDALVIVAPDGHESTFRRKGAEFLGAEGERGRLAGRPGGGWIYSYPDLAEDHFDTGGDWIRHIDANGRATTLRYESSVGASYKPLKSVVNDQGRELHLSYNSRGLVESVTTPDGQRISYEHDREVKGQEYDLLGVTFADGRAVGYLYDERALVSGQEHKLTGITGGDGERFASFAYDSFLRAERSSHGDDLEWTKLDLFRDGEIVVSTRDGKSSQTWQTILSGGRTRLSSRSMLLRGREYKESFSYLDGGLVGRQTNFLGTLTTYAYDDARKLETERTEGVGTSEAHLVKTTWHAAFDKPVRIDHGTHWTDFAYDARGNLTERREGGVAEASDPSSPGWPDQRVTRFSYDNKGHLVAVDGPMAGDKDTSRYGYRSSDAPGCDAGAGTCAWRTGDLHTETNALGHITSIDARDGTGRVLSSTDVNGVRTDRRYDGAGRVLEIAQRARRDAKPSAEDIIVRMTYNANGDLDTIVDPDGGEIKHSYNAAHRLVEQVDSIGNRRITDRDGQGFVGTAIAARRDGTEDFHRDYTYDAQGAIERIRDRDGFSISYGADANGLPTGMDGNTVKVALKRDARGRVTQVTSGKLSTTSQILMAYDGLNSAKAIVDPKELSTGYLRNGLGDLLWQQSPDTGQTTFDNNELGQPIRATRADGSRTDYDYDLLGRLVAMRYNDGRETRFKYDAAPTD
jgi:YD repeat-containing protein